MLLGNRLVEETRRTAWRELEARGVACVDAEPRAPRRFVTYVARVDAAIVVGPELEPLRRALARASSPAIARVAELVGELRRAEPSLAVARVDVTYAPMTIEGSHDIVMRFVIGHQWQAAA